MNDISAETVPQPRPRDQKKRKLLAKRWRRFVDGRVYFARAGDAIKIGFSTNAEVRLATLQTGHHETITLLAVIDGSQKDERALHRQFRDLHLRGEWFRADPRLLAYIDFISGKPEPKPIRIAQKPPLAAEQEGMLTKIRGMVRRSPEGIAKQQMEVLAPQLQNGVPARYLDCQAALMAGLPLPVRPLSDSAAHALAVIAEAKLRFAIG